MHRHKLSNRACKHCSTTDVESLDLLLELPFPDPIIEDELHVLRTCPLYEDLRHCLSQQSKTLLFSDIGQIFAHPTTIGDLGRFLTKAHERRLPKASSKQIPNINNIAYL